MQNTYAQKNDTVQIASANTAESVWDNSAQAQSLQRKADLMNASVQRAPEPRPNLTGMPDNLKSGIESLSGFSMDDVRVHYNSSKPATVQALAYTQGTDIHVAPGQEHTLPHEAWHVAQQMAGRVSPTTNINGMPVNDNAGLEHEADVMGEKAVQCKNEDGTRVNKNIQCEGLLQRRTLDGFIKVADGSIIPSGVPTNPNGTSISNLKYGNQKRLIDENCDNNVCIKGHLIKCFWFGHNEEEYICQWSVNNEAEWTEVENKVEKLASKKSRKPQNKHKELKLPIKVVTDEPEMGRRLLKSKDKATRIFKGMSDYQYGEAIKTLNRQVGKVKISLDGESVDEKSFKEPLSIRTVR